MTEARRDPDFVSDPAINQYLNDMAHHLVAFAPSGGPDLVVFGVRDPVVNAFAMPGGFIGVNTGLIVSTKSESELAGVLAHEAAHVVQRHMARGLTQQKQSNAIMLASMAAAILAALAMREVTRRQGLLCSARRQRWTSSSDSQGKRSKKQIASVSTCSAKRAMTQRAWSGCLPA